MYLIERVINYENKSNRIKDVLKELITTMKFRD